MKHLIYTMLAAGIMMLAALCVPKAGACTRVVYKGADSLYVVGRSLDWKTPIPTNLYVYPAGMEKQGDASPGSVRWKSRYGAVYAVGYDGGVTEGMNEKGLVVSGLFCKGTVYSNDSTKNLAPMSLAMFPAWLLDMNATVPEVLEAVRKHDFNLAGSDFDGGTAASLHWGVTDAQGRSAVFEFDHGKISIHTGEACRVLTNDPQWDDMQAIEKYWEAVKGVSMLPGTVRSSDRYVRAAFFVRNVEAVPDQSTGVAICRSVLQVCSVPYLYTVEGEPNVSSTQWRSFADVRDKCYYFDIVTNPGLYYIDLRKTNLRPGAPVLKLDTSESSGYLGDVTAKLKKSKPFIPMY